MKRSIAAAIKSAPGKCKLTVIETPTRDALVSDTGGDTTTIAYVAIGAEAWGALLSAAPDLLAALQGILHVETTAKGRSDIRWDAVHAAIAKATKS